MSAPIWVSSPTETGERNWHCSAPHGPSGRRKGVSMFGPRSKVEDSIRRHIEKYHSTWGWDVERSVKWLEDG